MQYEVTSEKYAQDVMEGSLLKVRRNAEELLRIFTEAILKDTICETWDFYKSGMDKLEALANYLEIGTNEEKQRVYYFAVMKTILELGCLLSQKSGENEEAQAYVEYKYIYPVLELLAESGGLSVCKIADRLSISRNTLSNSFHRTDKFGLWRMEKRGKKHYYHITAKGKRAYQNYCLSHVGEATGGTEKMLLLILDLVGKELEKENPDASHIIYALNERYNKGISVASSAVLKVKLKEVFIKSEAGVCKRKWKKMRLTEMERKERRLWCDEPDSGYYDGSYQFGMDIREEVF